MTFNREQKEAIESDRETVIVVAGPGSGKTATLVGRIVHRVQSGVAPDRIVCVTFTNAAAAVISQRLIERKIAKLGYVGTLHGYCLNLIQQYGTLIGYGAGPVTIITEEAKEELLDAVIVFLGKQRTLTIAKVLQSAESADGRLVMGEYRFRLKRANMIDFDGLLRDGLTLIKELKLVRPSHSFEELLVDERQDSAEIDTKIFWAMPARRRFFVGDPDQSIYAFRGGLPDMFVEEAERLDYIALETNYRSDYAICDAANSLIEKNVSRVKKRIQPVSASKGMVVVRAYDDESSEVYGTWGIIKSQSVIPYSEMAVLARTNDIAKRYRELLASLGIPVGNCFFSALPADWSFCLNMIGLAVNPDNDLYAEAALRYKGVTQEAIQKLKLEAARDGTSLLAKSKLPGATLPRSESPSLLILKLRAAVSPESMLLVTQRLAALPRGATIGDLMADLWQRKWGEPQTDEDCVTVTTVHQVKGREFSLVLVVGLEEGVFPLNRGDAEEERRLCYVAVTRAKHWLHLSWVRKRMAFFRVHEQESSRFLREMNVLNT